MSEKEVVKGEAVDKGVKAINPMLILMVILILAAIATYIVPAGSFERVASTTSKYQMVVPNSYHAVQANPVTPFGVFKAIPKGLASSGGLIFFLLIVGGVLQVVQGTGAVDIGLKNLIKKFAGKEKILLLVILLVFGIITCFAACSEEYLAFIPLIYMVCLGIGFDSLTVIFIVFNAATIGYAGGMTNAFTVGVAQTIAELPLFSGMWYRTIVFIVFEIVSMIYIYFYAKKIQKDPTKSIMYDIDEKYRKEIDLDLDSVPEFTKKHKQVLWLFVIGTIIAVIGIIKYDFYLTEMAAIFIILSALCGKAGGMDANTICNEFIKGAQSLVWAGFIMGICKAVTMVVTDAKIIDTLIYSLATPLAGLPTSIAACGMFVVQCLINFVVPSGSGQAAVTMPFMVPLGDMLGLTRQTNVLAFQFGDSFSNMLTPAGAKLMAGLAMCHIPYKKWLKFFMPMFGIWCIVAFIMLIIAVKINYGPF